MSKVVLRALDLIGNHLRTHKSGGGADAPLDLAKQVVTQRMDNPAPAAPPAAEAAPKGNTTQGSVFAPKPRVVAPSGLYSHAAEVAGQLQQNKGSAEQMIGMMKNAGVKPAELEHAGMITEEGDVHPDWAGRTVTRDELHKHLTDSMPQVEERVLGSKSKYPYHTADEWSDAISRAQHNRNFDEAERLTLAWEEAEGYGSEYAPKYKKWSLPGGENYRELLLKSPKQEHPLNIAEKKVDEINQKLIEMERNGVSEDSAEWKAANAELMKADIAAQRVRNKVSSGEIPHQLENFRSSHWDDPDVLAHVRMSDRTGPNGEKLLHVEELQSDWGQQGREQGFAKKLDPKILDQLREEQTSAMFKLEDARKKFNDAHENIFRDNIKKVYENPLTEYDLPNALKNHEDVIKSTHPQKRFDEYRSNFLRMPDTYTPEQHALLQDAYDEHIEARDAHNAAKDKLAEYKSSSSGVPEAPYVTSTQGWTDLALKRVLKEAAEGGYHGIVFTPGAEQAKRYDLSQQVGRIDAEPANDGKIHLSASSPDMQNVVHRGFYHPDELDGVIGKELADKIRNQIEFPKTIQGHVVKNRKSGLTSDVFEKKEEAEKALNQYPDSIKNNLIVSPVEKKSHGKDVTLSGLDLSFGGEGMKSYYDKMVPSYLQKLAKQHDKDAKLGTLRTNSLPDMLHLPVTDKMRESVLKGQKAFADGGEVEPFKRGGTAKAHPASIIPGVHIVGHNPFFHGDE